MEVLKIACLKIARLFVVDYQFETEWHIYGATSACCLHCTLFCRFFETRKQAIIGP